MKKHTPTAPEAFLPAPLFVSTRGIMHAVGVSQTTLKTLRKQGLLGAPCRVGKRVLWTAEQVADLAERIKAGDAADIHVPISNPIAAKDAARAQK